MKGLKFPVYDGQGNVFDWIIREAEDFRRIQQRGNLNAAKAAKESQGLDRAKVADSEREAVDARPKSNRGKVSPGGSYTFTFPTRVCSDDSGKAGRKSKR
jgi:hypothetical protein